MTNRIVKPSFRREGNLITLEDVRLIFKEERNPDLPIKLLQADYGRGFRMATIPQLVSLVYSFSENREDSEARDLAQKLRSCTFVGNTGILFDYDGMFVKDKPEIENEKRFRFLPKLVMDAEKLKNMLGSREERGVVFSDDGKIRFTPYGFKVGSQIPSVLAKNSGVIAIVGSEENAEMLAQASRYYKISPEFFSYNRLHISPQIRIANIHSCNFGAHVTLDAMDNGIWGDSAKYSHSFGVRELKQGGKTKNARKTRTHKQN